MHRPTAAGPSPRLRRAVLAAVLVAFALPAAAHAGTAEVRDGKLTYTARNAEVNVVDVRVGPAGKLIVADSAPQLAGAGCLLNGSGDLECDAAGVTSIELTLADRNDVVRYRAPHPGRIDAGTGTDTFFGGLRAAATGPVSYIGGDGLADAVRYTEADRGVVVTLGASANDGRPGDLEDVRGDIEVLEGSGFGDTVTGTDDVLGELFLGGDGIDKIDARGGPDRIDERTVANGADTIDGGTGRDVIDYGRRATRVDISLDDRNDDGDVALREGDNVKSTVEDIISGRGDDRIFGSRESNDVLSGAGNDFVSTSDGRLLEPEIGGDTINPGSGRDIVQGGDENDVISARDRERDDIRCRGGLDFVTADPVDQDPINGPVVPDMDVVSDCEAVDEPVVGALRLDAQAGRPARIALSWRHPKAWRKLREIAVQVKHDGLTVGEIAIDPSAGRITADGAVKLVRRRLTRARTLVAARLAVRIDGRLAGERLALDVEATDRRGRRQLERGAGTLRG